MSNKNCRPLPDYIKNDLKILFVGFNPSIRSGEAGHHFASPSNRFWKILYQAGLTPTKYSYLQDSSLLELGYGLTNIVPRPTLAAADIFPAEYDEGRKVLRRKIELYLPQIVCFVGKGVYEQYVRHNKVDWGFQTDTEVPGVKEFVAPSSSGLVRMKLDEVVEIYRTLSESL